MWIIKSLKRRMSKRKTNFTIQEKNLLKVILRDYKNILENKKTDAATAKMKKDAWATIAKEYNSSPVVSEAVSPDQLRRLWLNMKSRQRKRLIAERQYRMLADRGACPDSLIDVEITNIAEAILEEVPSAQDSDTSFLPENEAVSMSSESADPLSSGMPHEISISEVGPTLRNEEQLKLFILQEEFKRREERNNELHKIELNIMQEKLKEATARATIANLELEKLKKDL